MDHRFKSFFCVYVISYRRISNKSGTIVSIDRAVTKYAQYIHKCMNCLAVSGFDTPEFLSHSRLYLLSSLTTGTKTGRVFSVVTHLRDTLYIFLLLIKRVQINSEQWLLSWNTPCHSVNTCIGITLARKTQEGFERVPLKF